MKILLPADGVSMDMNNPKPLKETIIRVSKLRPFTDWLKISGDEKIKPVIAGKSTALEAGWYRRTAIIHENGEETMVFVHGNIGNVSTMVTPNGNLKFWDFAAHMEYHQKVQGTRTIH